MTMSPVEPEPDRVPIVIPSPEFLPALPDRREHDRLATAADELDAMRVRHRVALASLGWSGPRADEPASIDLGWHRLGRRGPAADALLSLLPGAGTLVVARGFAIWVGEDGAIVAPRWSRAPTCWLRHDLARRHDIELARPLWLALARHAPDGWSPAHEPTGPAASSAHGQLRRAAWHAAAGLPAAHARRTIGRSLPFPNLEHGLIRDGDRAVLIARDPQLVLSLRPMLALDLGPDAR
jgi:hypothetical protein